MHSFLLWYMKVANVPAADIANRTVTSASLAAAAVRSDWIFVFSFLRAVAWASVRFGVPSQPIGCDDLPVRSVVGGPTIGDTGWIGSLSGLTAASAACWTLYRPPGPYRRPMIGWASMSICLSISSNRAASSSRQRSARRSRAVLQPERPPSLPRLPRHRCPHYPSGTCKTPRACARSGQRRSSCAVPEV